MTALTALVPRVRASIEMVPSFVAQQYLLQASREFFERTRAWRSSFDLDVTAATATYDLSASLPSTTELVDIVSVKPYQGGGPLSSKTQAWLDDNLNDWRDDTATVSNYYFISANNTIQLVATPDTTTTAAYHLRVAVKPTLSATTIDDLMNNKYDDHLVNGALARMFATPNKPWTSGELATYYNQKFEMAIPEAKSQATDENQVGVARKVRYGGY